MSEPDETQGGGTTDSGGGAGAPAANIALTAEQYEKLLDRMCALAACQGALTERNRIGSIMRLPGADGSPRLAWLLAESGAFTHDAAAEMLARAAANAAAPASGAEAVDPTPLLH